MRVSGEHAQHTLLFSCNDRKPTKLRQAAKPTYSVLKRLCSASVYFIVHGFVTYNVVRITVLSIALHELLKR